MKRFVLAVALLACMLTLLSNAVSAQVLTVTDDLALWLRGEDAIDAGGGAVALWPDNSGNANDATQAVAATRPSIIVGGISGRDAVRFDGSDDRLDLTVNAFTAADYPLTVFVVLQTTSSDRHIVGTGSSSAGFLTSFGSGLVINDDGLALKANNSSAGIFLDPGVSVSDGTPRILAARGEAGESSTWVDCAFQGSSPTPPNPFAYTKATVGSSDGSNSGASRDPLSGDIGEILVYHRALSTPERKDVESYLAARYPTAPCVSEPPAVELNDGLRLFYPLSELGTATRADVVAAQSLSPFPADALGITRVPAIVGQGQDVDGQAGYHFFRVSSAQLDLADESFTWAGWLKLESFYDSQTLVAKWNNNASAEREYRVWYNSSTSQFEFDVSGTGFEGAGDSVTVAHPQIVALDTFYFLEAWYDDSAETVNLRVSTESVRGTVASTAWNGGVHFGPADLNVAAHNTCNDAHLDGVVDALGLWGHVLTDPESVALWNSGNGLELNGQPGSVITVLDEFDPPGIGSTCGVGLDPLTGNVWATGCFGATVDEHSGTGILLGSVASPGEAANDVDLEFAPEALSLNGVPIAAGSLLFINGETGPAEIYAVDEGDGTVLATLATSFGDNHVVGGAYHPERDTFFLVQDRVPSTAAIKNLIGEIDPDTGAVINSFQVSPEYSVNFGDIDVCGTTGNLLLVSSDEPRIGEFTPDGNFVAGYPLPGAVTSLSGIALDDDSGEAWVSGSGGTLWRLTGVPCPVPEPSSTLMLVVGSVALLSLDRRRRATKHAPGDA